eukprot:scaffold5907_cov120-Isochrysis_galbana.AAC.12
MTRELTRPKTASQKASAARRRRGESSAYRVAQSRMGACAGCGQSSRRSCAARVSSQSASSTAKVALAWVAEWAVAVAPRHTISAISA